MSCIGVIMGKLLVSKEGLGYLIMYGSQVFNINLVISSVVMLAIISYFMYFIISILEKNHQEQSAHRTFHAAPRRGDRLHAQVPRKL